MNKLTINEHTKQKIGWISAKENTSWNTCDKCVDRLKSGTRAYCGGWDIPTQKKAACAKFIPDKEIHVLPEKANVVPINNQIEIIK